MRYRFQFRRYRLPFRTAVRTAHGIWTEREGVVVRLTPHDEGKGEGVRSKDQPSAFILEPSSFSPDARGAGSEPGALACGLGEAAPVPGFGMESVDEIETVCGEMGEWVEEERLFERAAHLPCLRNALSAAVAEAGRGFRPLSRTETDPKRAAAAPYLGVAVLLPAGRAALARIEPQAEIGFRVFKWKVGVGELADELSLLDDVCARLPSGAKLRLDANGAWDRRQSERWLERCAERPVEFVEQPCFADASQGAIQRRKADDMLLGLAGDFPTKIALDESLVGDGDVEKWLGAGWPGIFVVKPSLLGDLAGAMARLEKAKADVVFSSALETAVGARSALRAAFDWAGRQEAVNREGTRLNPTTETAPDAKAAKIDATSVPPRALGFGVYPLFQDARFNGPTALPFFRAEDVARIEAEATWKALG